VEACCKRRDVAEWTVPVSDLDVSSFWVHCCGRVFWGRNTPQRGCTVMTPLEIKGAMAAVITSAFILVATFTAGAIYQNHSGRETEPGNKPLAAEDLAVKGRSFFLRSCAQCHGRDADGGEDAPSLLKLQISGAHMTLVIQSGIKGEMPSFSKKYNAQDTAAIVAYLKTLH
jgi:mono/diheme cytochrome c family protein